MSPPSGPGVRHKACRNVEFLLHFSAVIPLYIGPLRDDPENRDTPLSLLPPTQALAELRVEFEDSEVLTFGIRVPRRPFSAYGREQVIIENAVC